MASRKVPAELLQAVVERFGPQKVIVFGSPEASLVRAAAALGNRSARWLQRQLGGE